MKLSLMTFTMLRDCLKKYMDADLLCKNIKDCGLDEADMMQMEFQLYGKEKLLAAMEKYGVRCGCLIMGASFYANPSAVEEEVRKGLELAREAGAKYLMVIPGNGDEADRKACARLTRQEILDQAAVHFRKAVELSGEYGIQVCFENTPHAFKPLASMEDCRTLLEMAPGLKLVFDTANFRVADKGNDELASYEALKKWIVRYHLKEVRIDEFQNGEPCVGGKAMRASFPGTGVIPLQEIIRASLGDGFDGTFVIEYSAPSDTHACGHREAIAAYVDMLRDMERGERPKCPQAVFPGLKRPVSRLFFGTATLPMAMEANAMLLLDYASASGINAFDCARGYGRAEAVLGQWMQERKNRREVVILTKCGNVGANGKVAVNREVIERELEESLQNLQTDYIDIFLLHRDDPDTPIAEILETLNRVKKEGKVIVFGVSNWSHERIREANAYARENGLEGFRVSSPNYGLARQVADPWGGGCVSVSGPEGRSAREWYAKEQLPLIAYSSLGRGFFSGRFKSYDYEGAKKVLDPFAQKGYLSEDNMARIHALEQYAEEKNVTVAQAALQFVLSSPMNVFAVASMSAPKRIRENVKAAQTPMDEEDWSRLDLIGQNDQPEF
ncbi:MAG: aldo/keto reductase [Lachnospiraceae bacterium]|nr:aldo/keto reductase [Lachnospiraceae bacterium]